MMYLEKGMEKDSRCSYKYSMIYSAMAAYIIVSIITFIMNLCRTIQPIIQFLVERINQFFQSVYRDIENHTSKYKGVDE